VASKSDLPSPSWKRLDLWLRRIVKPKSNHAHKYWSLSICVLIMCKQTLFHRSEEALVAYRFETYVM
jgi:hypothetical protein